MFNSLQIGLKKLLSCDVYIMFHTNLGKLAFLALCHSSKAIVTNFHQPQSTLLLLVSALIGEDWRKVYDYALAHDFRFLSYGDSSLLIP